MPTIDIKPGLDKTLAKYTQRIAIEVLRRVILATPVDTGLARGSHVVQNQSGGMDPNGGATINTGIASIKNEITPQHAYTQVTLTNNVSYFKYLEQRYQIYAQALEDVKSLV